MEDLTPKYTHKPAAQTLYIPPPISAPQSELVGGFQATPGNLRAGKLILDAEHQQILVGNILGFISVPSEGFFVGVDNATGFSRVQIGTFDGTLQNDILLYFQGRLILLGMITVGYNSTIVLDNQNCTSHYILTVDATGNASVDTIDSGFQGQTLKIVIENDATSPKTISFGGNLRAAGNIVGSTNKVATICFISTGSFWVETSRTLNL